MTIEEYFGTLQQSFVEIWKNHLQTDKYSDHKALNEYYDDIVDAVDKLIEDWMGIHGKVKDLTNTISTEYDEPKEYLKALKKFAKEGRQELIPEEDTELWSDVDDILGLIDSTLYKLEELDESVNTSSLSRYLKESLNESIQGGNSIKNLKDGIARAVDMRDFPYIREIARDYKKRLQNPKFLSALDAIQGCDNDFKIWAVYDMMGYVEAQYEINDGDEDAMDWGAVDMIEKMTDPKQNQYDFLAFLNRNGNPNWVGSANEYAEIAKLFLDHDFELM